jgi:LDH2 family malate/lactate/ureidoglycolate dehydrogenase
MPVFMAEQLRKAGTKIFLAAGTPHEEAEWVSNLLVKANLVGHDSHGVIRFIQYVRAIQKGDINPDAETEVVKETRASALLNGNWGFGQIVAKKAMEIAISKARENTVGTVCAFNAYHIGRLADYTMMAVENDMVGIAMANSMKNVAAYGGTERLLSTGPLSYAFPTGSEVPFVLDIATSVVAEGKVRVTLHKQDKLPEGCIIDKNGNPSTNPADLYDGGALLPLGGDTFGYKGFGIGLVVEILSGILSKSGLSYLPEKKGNGLFFQAMDIESFMPVDEFKEQIDALIRKTKSSKLRPGFTEILIPGEPELRNEKERLKQGIYIPDRTWEEIKATAATLNLYYVLSAYSSESLNSEKFFIILGYFQP